MELAAVTPVLLWMLSDNHDVPDVNSRSVWTQSRGGHPADATSPHDEGRQQNDGCDPEGTGPEYVRRRPVTTVRFLPSRRPRPGCGRREDIDLRSQLPEARLYGNIRQGRLRVVLGAVEKHLRDGAAYEAVRVPAGLEIEHIMPQGWRAHWDTADDDAGRAQGARQTSTRSAT